MVYPITYQNTKLSEQNMKIISWINLGFQDLKEKGGPKPRGSLFTMGERKGPTGEMSFLVTMLEKCSEK